MSTQLNRVSAGSGDTPATRKITPDKNLVLSVTESRPIDDIGAETLLRLASSQPANSPDPVDQALLRAVDPDYVYGTVESFSPATPSRKYSLSVVRNAKLLGERQDVAVMRGDLASVIQASAWDKHEMKTMMQNVDTVSKFGNRCMGVAVAPVDGDTTGEFVLKGYIAFGIGDHVRPRPVSKGGYTRIEMWPVALRWQHWINMLLIIIMTITGYFIMDPFFGPSNAHDAGMLMGWNRLIHFVAAFAWIALSIWRLAIMVFAQTRQMKWRALWPVRSQDDLKLMWEQTKYYLLLTNEPPPRVGHNGLQQTAYTGIYALCMVQIYSGLALFGLAKQESWFWRLMAAPVEWIGVPYFRLVHALIMFIIWAFVILHVYLVFRADATERHGGLSAMINGGVWLPQGTKPVDGPEVE